MEFYRKICSLCYWKEFTKTQPAFHVRIVLILCTVFMILLIAYFADPVSEKRSPISHHKIVFTYSSTSFIDLDQMMNQASILLFFETSSAALNESSPPPYITTNSLLIWDIQNRSTPFLRLFIFLWCIVSMHGELLSILSLLPPVHDERNLYAARRIRREITWE